jgi:hypothetical protein
VDVNELVGRVDQKRRLAAEIARDRGWIAETVAVWVIVAMSRTNRRRLARHKTTLRAAFPADGRTVMRWVAGPAGTVSALSYWPDAPGESTNARLATVKRVRKPADAAA